MCILRGVSTLGLQQTFKMLFSTINVYADGSCFGNGRADAVGGCGIYFQEYNDKYKVKLGSGYTNQQAELYAIVNALELIEKDIEARLDYGRAVPMFVVKSDSKYAINCLTKWAPKWIDNSWLTSRGEPVKNKNIIETCLNIMNNICNLARRDVVNVDYVPGHSGDYGNDIADQAAREAADESRRFP